MFDTFLRALNYHDQNFAEKLLYTVSYTVHSFGW